MRKTLLSLTLLATLTMAKPMQYDFENTTLKGWSQAGTWQREAEKENKILTLTQESKTYFNFCYTKDIHFINGEVSVQFRANSGHSDQGGGLMWRVQDDNNYYVARFNPLEDNFRFYIVHDGMRSELASADIKLSQGWHTMKIIQKDAHFEGYIDGNKLLSHDDTQLSKTGGVGVWTKSDALTSFDDLQIQTDK